MGAGLALRALELRILGFTWLQIRVDYCLIDPT